jgi:hypothetical protein
MSVEINEVVMKNYMLLNWNFEDCTRNLLYYAFMNSE